MNFNLKITESNSAMNDCLCSVYLCILTCTGAYHQEPRVQQRQEILLLLHGAPAVCDQPDQRRQHIEKQTGM